MTPELQDKYTAFQQYIAEQTATLLGMEPSDTMRRKAVSIREAIDIICLQTFTQAELAEIVIHFNFQLLNKAREERHNDRNKTV